VDEFHPPETVTVKAWLLPDGLRAQAAGRALMAIAQEPDVRALLTPGCFWLGYGAHNGKGIVAFACCDQVRAKEEVVTLFEQIMEEDLGARKPEGEELKELEDMARKSLDRRAKSASPGQLHHVWNRH
jgi:hypothetical protein